MSGDLAGPLLAVDGSATLHGTHKHLLIPNPNFAGQLHVAIRESGSIGSSVLLKAKQGVSLRGPVRIEGVRHLSNDYLTTEGGAA